MPYDEPVHPGREAGVFGQQNQLIGRERPGQQRLLAAPGADYQDFQGAISGEQTGSIN